MMMKEKTYVSLIFYATLLVVVTLPFSIKANGVSIVLLTAIWLLGSKKFNSFAVRKDFILLLIFVGLYLFYVVGHLYSEDKHYSLSVLETKLPLMIFPLIFYSAPPLGARKVWTVLYAFVGTCLVAGVYSFLYVVYEQQVFVKGFGEVEPWFFINRNFTQGLDLHPLYFSCYLNLSLAIALWLLSRNETVSRLGKMAMGITAVMLILFNFLASSRAGLLVMLIMLIGSLFFAPLRRKLWRTSVLLLMFLLIIFVHLYYFNRTFRHRIDATFSDNNVEGSFKQREEIWRSSYSLFRKNWLFGVGTGDVKNALEAEYELNGYEGPYYNCHNEYLQTGVAMGAVGVFLLITSFTLPIFMKAGEIIYVAFLLSLLICFFTESMLWVQKGVVFYAFFNALFAFGIKRLPDESKNKA